MYRPNNWKSFAEYLLNTSEALRGLTVQDANSTTAKRTLNSRHALHFAPHRFERRADPNEDDQSSPDLDFSGQAIACSDAIDNPNVTTRDMFDFVVNVTDTPHGFVRSLSWIITVIITNSLYGCIVGSVTWLLVCALRLVLNVNQCFPV
jgi:hypothetical protein